MHNKWKEKRNDLHAQVAQSVYLCDCQLLSINEAGVPQQDERIVPIPLALYAQLKDIFAQISTSVYPLSLILLHVMQREQVQVPLEAAVLQQWQCCHAPPGLLEQVLVNVRRVIRVNDQLVIHPDIAAALILPYVDEQAINSIQERIYHSVSLLQAETVIPPLQQETVIQLGAASTSAMTDTGEALLMRATHQVNQISLKPTIQVQPWIDDMQIYHTRNTQPAPMLHIVEPQGTKKSAHAPARMRTKGGRVPFMRLPEQLPERLRHIIPHPLACELRCAPVGRSHSNLTVAMANPGDAQALDRLKEMTGMAIFPVACEEDALDQLLDQRW